MVPEPIGYFPRRRTQRPEGPVLPAVPNVEEICSFGHYVSDGPENWVDQWRHNELWLFDSEAVALKVAAEAIRIDLERDDQRDLPWRARLIRAPLKEFDLYAYKLFPLRFSEGRQESWALPSLAVEPFSPDYQCLGYDPVNKTCAHFECSPLFCNGVAEAIPVNRYCLIDEPERALELARQFSDSNGIACEPGPYFVVEVWRKGVPLQEFKEPEYDHGT